MNRIGAEIDGVFVPLDQCAWIMQSRCGCIVAAVLAQVDGIDGWTLATVEQAHEHMEDSPSVRRGELAAGYSFVLDKADNIGLWKCGKHESSEKGN